MKPLAVVGVYGWHRFDFLLLQNLTFQLPGRCGNNFSWLVIHLFENRVSVYGAELYLSPVLSLLWVDKINSEIIKHFSKVTQLASECTLTYSNPSL